MRCEKPSATMLAYILEHFDDDDNDKEEDDEEILDWLLCR